MNKYYLELSISEKEIFLEYGIDQMPEISALCKRTIIIKDTTAPEIKLVSNPESFTSPVGTYEEEGFSAIDNYDGDLTDKVTKEMEFEIALYLMY